MAFLLLCAVLASAQVQIPSGEVIPKDKFVTYIFIGHSNMSGRAAPLDSSVTERTWNFWIPDGRQSYTPYAWTPAKQPFFKDDDQTASGSAVYVLRKLAAAHPEYHLGAVQNAKAGATASWSYSAPGGDLFAEMCGALRRIKGTVTFGGILCMLGVCDAYTQSSSQQFCANVTRTVQAIRDSLGEPSLPFLIGEFEDGGPPDNSHPYWRDVQAQIDSIGGRILNSAIISSDSLTYRDLWHYDTGGVKKWADRAAGVIEQRFWPFRPRTLQFTGAPFPTTVFLDDTVHIRWTTGTAHYPAVIIKLSTDGGLTWVYLTDPIQSGRPDFGDYVWTVRDSADTMPILGRTCVLMITDYDRLSEDVSNGFTVTKRGSHVLRPQGRSTQPARQLRTRKLLPGKDSGPGVRVRPLHGPDQTITGRALTSHTRRPAQPTGITLAQSGMRVGKLMPPTR